MRQLGFALAATMLPFFAYAQMDHAGGTMAPMHHEAGTPSRVLLLTGLNGETKSLTIEGLKALPHTTVTVTNGHSHKEESYSGVPVKDLLAMVTAKAADGAPRVSPRMIVVVAGGTDRFRIAITLCDTDPGCRSGQAIVADSVDGHPLATDGAFKLILTEDKMPGRWVRNLDSLTERNLGAQ